MSTNNKGDQNPAFLNWQSNMRRKMRVGGREKLHDGALMMIAAKFEKHNPGNAAKFMSKEDWMALRYDLQSEMSEFITTWQPDDHPPSPASASSSTPPTNAKVPDVKVVSVASYEGYHAGLAAKTAIQPASSSAQEMPGTGSAEMGTVVSSWATNDTHGDDLMAAAMITDDAESFDVIDKEEGDVDKAEDDDVFVEVDVEVHDDDDYELI